MRNPRLQRQRGRMEDPELGGDAAAGEARKQTSATRDALLRPFDISVATKQRAMRPWEFILSRADIIGDFPIVLPKCTDVDVIGQLFGVAAASDGVSARVIPNKCLVDGQAELIVTSRNAALLLATEQGYVRIGGANRIAFRHVLFVDLDTLTPTAAQDGSMTAPFSTLSAAFAAIPAPTTDLEASDGYAILATPGYYPGGFTVSGARSVSLQCWGVGGAVRQGPIVVGSSISSLDTITWDLSQQTSTLEGCAFGVRGVRANWSITGAATTFSRLGFNDDCEGTVSDAAAGSATNATIHVANSRMSVDHAWTGFVTGGDAIIPQWTFYTTTPFATLCGTNILALTGTMPSPGGGVFFVDSITAANSPPIRLSFVCPNLSANQNDYSAGNPLRFYAAEVLILNATGAVDITGLLRFESNTSWPHTKRVIILAGSANITFKHNNAGSSALNRINCKGAADIVAAAGDIIGLTINPNEATNGRWFAWKE